jgi:hypothetical protein
MAAEFQAVFAALKPVLGKFAKRLEVKADTPIEYTRVTKSASPFPQHKGQPLYFGSVRLGKAYVSFHPMPLYMHPVLTKTISACCVSGGICSCRGCAPAPVTPSATNAVTPAIEAEGIRLLNVVTGHRSQHAGSSYGIRRLFYRG